MIEKAIIEENADVIVVFPELVHDGSKGATGMILFEVGKLGELGGPNIKVWERLG